MPTTVFFILLLTSPTQSFPSKSVDSSENLDWRFNQDLDQDELEPQSSQDPTTERESTTSSPSPPPFHLTTGSDGSWQTSNKTFVEQCWEAMETVSGEILSWTEDKPGKEQLLIRQAVHQVLTSSFFWALFLALMGYLLSLTSNCIIAYCCRPKQITPTVVCRHKETKPPVNPKESLVHDQHTSQLHRLEQAISSTKQDIVKQGLVLQHFMKEQFATIKPQSHPHQHLLDSSSIATSTATLTTLDSQAPPSEYHPNSLKRSKSVKAVSTPQPPRQKIDLADFEDSSDCESQYEMNREQMALSLGAIPKLTTKFLPSRRPAPLPPQPATTFTRQTGGGLRSSMRGSKRTKKSKFFDDDDSKFM